MAAASRKVSVVVAASMGAVEALKDQAGLCRWNYALRSLQRCAKSVDAGSLSQAKRASSTSTVASVERRSWMTMMEETAGEKAKRSEEALRTVMYLGCWGPN